LRILPDGAPPLDINARVLGLDNSREKVVSGVIRGVRSTDTFQDHLSTRLLRIPAWDPDTFWILSAREAAFPVSPEPEIFLPRGTDMLVEFSAPVALPDGAHAAVEAPGFDDAERQALNQEVLALPERAFTGSGRSGDIVNLAFIGSHEQLQTAFRNAGWTGSDSVSAKSILREMHAVFALNSYPRLPISKELLDGALPDASWQKSLDSFSMRDHLRIWSRPEVWEGQPIWLSGSIHEKGAGLSPRRHKFVHYLDANLDEERSKVVRDLTVAGCVDAVYNAPRPTVPRYLKSPTGDNLYTDGAISVVRLKNCNGPAFVKPSPEESGIAYRPSSKLARYFRTQILTFRSDTLRSNAPFTAFELSWGAIRRIRESHARALSRKQTSDTLKAEAAF
ncbi:MAG TPA: LssY C-terminal domain-containing protein, partial [Terriglobales bacterium]|nr:LssY C-terminal domain-containing protein [Terriglobales bacterium]